MSTARTPTAFSTANQNVADNKILCLDALAFAKRTVRQRKWNNKYVTVPKFALIVPTTMKDQAERILKITQLEIVVGDGTAGGDQRRYTSQTSNSDVVLVVNDYLTKIDKSANAANTWYLVPLNG